MLQIKLFDPTKNKFRENCIYVNRNGINTTAYNSQEQEECEYKELYEIEILDTDRLYPGFLYYLILGYKDKIDKFRTGIVPHINKQGLKKGLTNIMFMKNL